MKVLFISHWYPHRKDSMWGLFVQKHADAVSIYADVQVINVQPEEDIKKFEIEENVYNKVREIHIYYPAGGSGLWSKIRKTINYFRAYIKGFSKLKKSGWKPDIVHANVLTRTVAIARAYKFMTGTPYVITEHWTRLLKSQDNFHGYFRNKLAHNVVKNAGCIMPVSYELKEGLEFNNLLLTRCEIVENVVDNLFYETYPVEKPDKMQLLNITCFAENHKNVFGLLCTVRKIAETRDDFRLILVGTGDDFEKTMQFYQSLDFPEDTVLFAGLKTSLEVAQMMQQATGIVQFSNYESAGVVVQEALVSGRPVISTKVGIAPVYIHASNGILVDVKAEDQLFDAITYLLDHPGEYDNEAISEAAQAEFSYERIGKKYFDIYRDILEN